MTHVLHQLIVCGGVEVKVTIQKKILILCIFFWYFSFWQKARNVLVPPLQCIAFPFMRVLKGVECGVGATHPWDRPSVTRSKKKKYIRYREPYPFWEVGAGWTQAGRTALSPATAKQVGGRGKQGSQRSALWNKTIHFLFCSRDSAERHLFWLALFCVNGPC